MVIAKTGNRRHSLGPFNQRFLARNSHSMETSSCCYVVAGHPITTYLCTYHDSATTARLSYHFVAITKLESMWEWNELFIEFELGWKNRQWNGEQDRFDTHNKRTLRVFSTLLVAESIKMLFSFINIQHFEVDTKWPVDKKWPLFGHRK